VRLLLLLGDRDLVQMTAHAIDSEGVPAHMLHSDTDFFSLSPFLRSPVLSSRF
jgi:hypothetical protein